MTINGAITQLVMMTENSMMPNIFRPALNKVIETISELEPEPHWIPCSEYPEYDFEDVLIRWHDKRKGCKDDYILCEGYVVKKYWCCIFEDADMSDYEPVEWQPLPSPYREEQ